MERYKTMATIFPRMKKDGTLTYRVLLRRRGLKTFCTSFDVLQEAQEFVDKYEGVFCLDPQNFQYEELKRYRKDEFRRKKDKLVDDFMTKGGV